MEIDKETTEEPRPDAGDEMTVETPPGDVPPGREDPDRYIRLLAEFDNYRRRSVKEREIAFETGAAELARPLLSVLDNLERALSHADGVPGAWLDGMKLTVRQFLDGLKSAGVETVEPAGEAFDPRFHEALATVPSDRVPPEHVLEVVTRGYRIGDRVLRPAQVVVAQEPGSNS